MSTWQKAKTGFHSVSLSLAMASLVALVVTVPLTVFLGAIDHRIYPAVGKVMIGQLVVIAGYAFWLFVVRWESSW